MDWYESFFDGAWRDVQPQMWTPEQTRSQVDAIERLCELDAPADVLDVPCGTGRHSVELATRGHRVTGVDRSERFLSLARAHPSEVTWERRDMRDLPWTDAFDAAVCFWGSFGYFDDDGNFAFLAAVRRALRDGGRMLIDTHVVESLLPRFEPRRWDRSGDTLLVQEAEWDHASGRIESEWTFVTAGHTRTDRLSIRLYTYRELTELLSEAGFTSWTGYATLDGEPFELGSQRLHMVARA
ncbi:MAG TPA: class I SAM-dependent methyltransferase [Actinomycetota bacterium]|nr:class I SAM-dependent methyltransferase [Actinomycetota bacterium]